MSDRTADGRTAEDEAARWRMLALLFAVRTAMAFQFQAVGALSTLLLTPTALASPRSAS